MSARSFLFVAALVALTACPSKNPTLEVFCTEYTDAVCARLAECQGATAADWCTVAGKQRLCAEVAASERNGTTRYQGDYAKACLDIVASLPCRFLAGSSNTELDVVCSEALNGLVPMGGDCRANRECERDFHCDRSATRCPGVCRRLRDGDEACDELNGVLCATGLSCINGACTIALTADAGCDDSRECEAGLFCDAFRNPATCAPVRSDGPCHFDEGDCAAKASCTGQRLSANGTGTCAVSKQQGAACTVGQNECNTLLSCVGGACTSWSKVAGTCGSVSGERLGCLEGGCDETAGVCVSLGAGEPCTDNAQCGQGGQCIGTPRVCVLRCAPQ